MPKSKLKPSEWILKRAKEFAVGRIGDYVDYLSVAILDYLAQQEDNLTK